VEDGIGDFFTRGLEGQGQNGGFIYRLFHGDLDTDYWEWLQIDSLLWYRISLIQLGVLFDILIFYRFPGSLASGDRPDVVKWMVWAY
jgi:hypothetical protein